MYLTFTTEAAALAALIKVNQNMGVPLVSIDAQTHQPEPECQRTLAWNNLTKAHGQNMWFFMRPPEQFMQGVENFTVKDFDLSWFPPVAMFEF